MKLTSEERARICHAIKSTLIPWFAAKDAREGVTNTEVQDDLLALVADAQALEAENAKMLRVLKKTAAAARYAYQEIPKDMNWYDRVMPRLQDAVVLSRNFLKGESEPAQGTGDLRCGA